MKELFKIRFVILYVLLMHNCLLIAQSQQSNYTTTPKKTVLDYSKLLEVKSKIKTTSCNLWLKKTLQSADEALKQNNYSVVQKTQTPTSGTKHDYLSIGPYWWPDQTKADGLPWIRKDGKINPLTRNNNTDFEAKERMFNNTHQLALAYFFSDKKQYADKALELLKVWFLNQDTKMNPNLNFAQGIPGQNSGRGIGIIEFADVTKILESIEILESNAAMDFKTSQGLRNWFTDYLLWLQTSDNGIFEKNTKNNHGTHYDCQLVSILIFLDRIEEAKQVLETVKTERIAKQIEPNGAQPLELARTKALSYSTMNLKGFVELAIYGKKLGVDLINFKANNGASILTAFEFLKPYAKEDKEWDFKQISDSKKATEKLKELFALAGNTFGIEEYCQIGEKDKNSIDNCFLGCYKSE